MTQLRASIRENEPAREVTTEDDVSRLLLETASEARKIGRLNVIHLHAQNGNKISLVVGGDETVVGFIYGHGKPPYLVSLGESTEVAPVLTAYVALAHHTEFPRKWVVSSAVGARAAVEFFRTGDLPRSIRWVEA